MCTKGTHTHVYCTREHTFMRTLKHRHTHEYSSDNKHVFSWNKNTCLVGTQECGGFSVLKAAFLKSFCDGRERAPVAGRLATKQNFLALVALKNNAGPFSDALRISY